MSRKSYKENINQLLDTIDSVIREGAILPGLILIYSGIDIMAWLNRDNTNQGNQRSYFKNWVNNYLLPDSGLNCNADDLYAARCAILHTYTSESDLSKDGKARKIFYACGPTDGDKLQQYINISSESGKTIVLHVDTLNNAFKNAFKYFNRALNKNQSLSKLVSKRSDKYLVSIPSEIIDNKV